MRFQKAAYDFKPTYIGGTYKNIAFTEVFRLLLLKLRISNLLIILVQCGHGITGISKGRIGHIHCDDYGMIMLISLYYA